ncbi:hypothetical protein ACFQZQ_00805 [Lysobacter koreensis]|uniref:Uncharacterized protein n=1 Tax=Lysobacter koreensis TaxID=266122 RepID=A0ABW2YJG3_9GAMM
MNTTLKPAARAVAAAAILLAASTQAPAQSILSIHNDASGYDRVFLPADSVFLANGDGKAINVTVAGPGDAWYLRFEAPAGETLGPGVYTNAGCPLGLRMGRAPGMGITDNNPVCSDSQGIDNLFGSFAIRQIDYDAEGNLTSLEATFTQRLGSANAPALGGLIRYQARPLSLLLNASPAFAWGAIAQANHGDTSVFTLDGTVADGFEYQASVLKDTWRISVAPPTGQPLKAKTYQTSDAADPDHASLRIRRGLGAMAPACANPSGKLEIQSMKVNGAGAIQNLRATFVYRCSGSAAALRGTIRYLD